LRDLVFAVNENKEKQYENKREIYRSVNFVKFPSSVGIPEERMFSVRVL